MNSKIFNIKTKVWLYEGDSPWHFVTINKKISENIKMFETIPRRGFGSIPVNVQIGNTKWKTSIFPQKDATYILPLKREVRMKENIKNGETVKVSLTHFLQSSR